VFCLVSFAYLSHLLLIKICLLIASCFASCSTHDPPTPLGILFLHVYKLVLSTEQNRILSPSVLPRFKSLTQGSKPFAIVRSREMFRELPCTSLYLNCWVPCCPCLLSIVSQGLLKRFASLSPSYAALTKT
jgi:hypothetical protein